MNQTQRRRVTFFLPLLAACVADSRWPRIETQQWPAPMQDVPGAFESSSLQGVVLNEPGVEEVLVLRYGDPVQVRPAGATASYPLPFHDKEVQLKAGSLVLCSPGGKVEILWAGGTSIVFSGRTTGLVGSPSRGEPTFAFVELESAILDLRYGDQVRLLGGALISAEVGPLALERLNSNIMRIENQSKAYARIMFREADVHLGPGEEIHLPLLSAGGDPWTGAFDDGSTSDAIPLNWEGDAHVFGEAGGVRVVPGGDNEFRGLGLRMQLDAGESFLLHGYTAAGRAAPAPEGWNEPGAPVKPDVDVVPEPELESEVWVPVDTAPSGGEQASAGGGA
jgi:hypothetical protein